MIIEHNDAARSTAVAVMASCLYHMFRLQTYGFLFSVDIEYDSEIRA